MEKMVREKIQHQSVEALATRNRKKELKKEVLGE